MRLCFAVFVHGTLSENTELRLIGELKTALDHPSTRKELEEYLEWNIERWLGLRGSPYDVTLEMEVGK